MELLHRVERGETTFDQFKPPKSAVGFSILWNPLLLADDVRCAELLAVARRVEAADPHLEMRDDDTFRDDLPGMIPILERPRAERVLRIFVFQHLPDREEPNASDEPIVAPGDFAAVAAGATRFPADPATFEAIAGPLIESTAREARAGGAWQSLADGYARLSSTAFAQGDEARAKRFSDQFLIALNGKPTPIPTPDTSDFADVLKRFVEPRALHRALGRLDEPLRSRWRSALQVDRPSVAERPESSASLLERAASAIAAADARTIADDLIRHVGDADHRPDPERYAVVARALRRDGDRELAVRLLRAASELRNGHDENGVAWIAAELYANGEEALAQQTYLHALPAGPQVDFGFTVSSDAILAAQAMNRLDWLDELYERVGDDDKLLLGVTASMLAWTTAPPASGATRD